MQQLVDDGGLRLAGCVPQPPDPVAAEKLGDGPLPCGVQPAIWSAGDVEVWSVRRCGLFTVGQPGCWLTRTMEFINY